MASKKGIIITIIIIAAITGGSFSVWVIPENKDTTFVVTDYENYLDGVQNIHEVLEESVYMEFESLMEGKITPEEYISGSEVTSSQLTAQISEFVKSKPPEEWQTSYINYMESMKKFNEYILETKVYANMIINDHPKEKLDEILQKIQELKEESKELALTSNETRP